MPGNEHQGVWASPLLETVFGPEPKCEWTTTKNQAVGISLRGDLELLVLVFGELRRSYAELPGRWLCDLALPRVLDDSQLDYRQSRPPRRRGSPLASILSHQAHERVSGLCKKVKNQKSTREGFPMNHARFRLVLRSPFRPDVAGGNGTGLGELL